MFRRSGRLYGNATWVMTNDPDDWDDLDPLDRLEVLSRTIGTTVKILKRSYGNTLRQLRQLGRSKSIPEIITFIPVIENEFCLDTAEVKK